MAHTQLKRAMGSDHKNKPLTSTSAQHLTSQKLAFSPLHVTKGPTEVELKVAGLADGTRDQLGQSSFAPGHPNVVKKAS